MVRQAKQITLILFSALLLTDMAVFAQQSMTITTYYPPPIGAYDRLRLIPSGPADPIPPCTGINEWGSIYYDGPLKSLQTCIDDGSGGGIWGSISGGSSGTIIWDRDAVNSRVYLYNNGDFVGLGTNTPQFRLHLNGDGGILAKGSYGGGSVLTTAGAGTRLIWYPRKAAFRAGTVSGTEWDDAVIGNWSTAYGKGSRAMDDWAVVGGGLNNQATVFGSAIGGGGNNHSQNQTTFVGGGNGNWATGGYGATVIGGMGNISQNQKSTVGGGVSNWVHSPFSTISGGVSNDVSGDYATILGGWFNSINAVGDFSFIGGGMSNTANGTASAVVGGGEYWTGVSDPTWGNQANGNYSFIGGGQNNRANGTGSAIGGGGGYDLFPSSYQGNQATGDYSVIVGGYLNVAGGFDAVVGGGFNNRSTNQQSVVGGGANNQATQIMSVVAGGMNNQATGWLSRIGGGQSNIATNQNSIVAGGQSNISSGTFSTVSGGSQNAARCGYSWVGGSGMDISAFNFGSFVWGYTATPPFSVAQMNSFLIFPNYIPDQGKVGINTPVATTALDVNGSAKIWGLGPDPGGTFNVTIEPAAGINPGMLHRVVSSKRYKNNVQTLSISPDKVFDLRPVQFAYKTSGNQDVGFLAEEVENDAPELVLHNETGQPEAVYYDKVSLYLLGAAKELKKENTQLQNENAELRKRIQLLKKVHHLE